MDPELKNTARERVFTGRSQIKFSSVQEFEYWYTKYQNSNRENFFSLKELSKKLQCSTTTTRLIVKEYQNDRESFLKRIKIE